jgi:hypothetical protein
VEGAEAAVQAIERVRHGAMEPRSLQEYHGVTAEPLARLARTRPGGEP